MKPAPFKYHRPSNLDECTALLAQEGDDAALLAGGQNLVPLMRLKLAQPGSLIATGGIADLRTIEEVGGRLMIGARATYREVESSALVRELVPALQRTIELIATPQVRTRGTPCGNLCHADPASELPAVALLLGARLHLRSVTGERVLGADEFLQGPYSTARRADEILTHISFPRLRPSQRFAILEVNRQRGGYPLAGAAVALDLDGGVVREAAVVCFGVHSKALRIPKAEAALNSLGLTNEGLQAAVDAVTQAIEPHSDPFASAEYRRAAAGTLLKRALGQLAANGG